jgi:hypothetical protein
MSFDNVFVCYSAQNYLKALYLSHEEHEKGRSSKLILLMNRKFIQQMYIENKPIYWAVIEYLEDTNPYVRVLESDSTPRHLQKLICKTYLKLKRAVLKGEERRQLLEAVDEGERVFLFLERNYYSSCILRHRSCTLVEEGLAAYRDYPPVLLSGSGGEFPGSHEGIDEVWLQHPERAHGRAAEKARQVEFNFEALPSEAKQALLEIFGMKDLELKQPAAIITGQSWGCSSVKFADILTLYARVEDCLRANSLEVYFKPHPHEDLRNYHGLTCHVLEPLVPLEVFGMRDDAPLFECAVTVLGSSLTSLSPLARNIVRLHPSEVIVEEFKQSMLDKMLSSQLPELEGVLKHG